MRLALIAPLGWLTYQEDTTYQLMLPAQEKHPVYAEHYDWLRARQDFIILDNGAAEAEQVEDSDLLKLGIKYKVNEIAVPDVLGDAPNTYDRFHQFFNGADFDLLTQLLSRDDFGFGIVAQGQDHKTALHLVNAIMESPFARYVKTVYLPRLLLKSGDRYARIALANNIHSAHPELNLHLFGSAPSWPREAIAAAREAPMIRGMDTSMPFNFSIANKRMWNAHGGTPGRPDNYFEHNTSNIPLNLVNINVECMKVWAGGQDIGPAFARSQTPIRSL